MYLPGSFTPLVRIETATAELVTRLESELLSGNLSEQSQQWLARCGLTAERMQTIAVGKENAAGHDISS